MKTNTRKAKKREKATKTKSDIKFHFYDDQQSWFEGVTFSKDEKHIEHTMCQDNVVCHKIKNRSNIKYTKNEINNLLNRYISKISNRGLQQFIKFRHFQLRATDKETLNYPYFHPDIGMTEEHIYPLCDPTLRDIIVGFDMDDTLHQLGYFLNIPNKFLATLLSNLTRSKITYSDISEMYFGGKARLVRFKEMFQNLAKTIGMANVYIITSNPSTLLSEIIPDLYSTVFGVKFLKTNIKVAEPNKISKYQIIKEIMKQ